MQSAPREQLRLLVKRFGSEIGSDWRRCEALLRDVCGEHRKEIFALANAAREGIPADLQAGLSGNVPRQVLLARNAERLRDNLGMNEQLSHWTVEAWAYALGSLATEELKPASATPLAAKPAATRPAVKTLPPAPTPSKVTTPARFGGAPASLVAAPSQVATPQLVGRVESAYWMGVASIVVSVCLLLGPIGLLLGVTTLARATTLQAELQSCGNPSELVSKINRGKACAFLGTIASAILTAILLIALVSR